MTARILIVDDDPSIRRSLAEALVEEGYRVEAAESAEGALALLDRGVPDVVLSDVRMPGMDGIELLKLLRERLPAADVILMTGHEDMPTVARAMGEGAYDFLVKPLRIADVRRVLVQVGRDRRARRVNEEPVEAVDGDGQLVGRHPSMIGIYKRIGQVGARRANALILGETGTGKELVARAIHQHSPDAHHPFVAVNCSALPEALLESELFGHVKGAFTGAVGERRGRFALAGRGTILLDEIGDTTLAFQGKLLRVLEERTFYRVGGERPESSQARVLAATHQDLEDQVAEGTFREDLYYRLRVVEIRIPPLRERMSDLPLLARHFVRKASLEMNRPEVMLPDETLKLLLQHNWPGNVRELENCLVRAVVLASGGVIRAEHLGLSKGSSCQGGLTDDVVSVEDAGRVQLERALTVSGGNRTQAAQLLGVSRPRLYRMLQKYDLA
jgi:two-component system, NtrC family, response regulator AtoC